MVEQKEVNKTTCCGNCKFGAEGGYTAVRVVDDSDTPKHTVTPEILPNDLRFCVESPPKMDIFPGAARTMSHTSHPVVAATAVCGRYVSNQLPDKPEPRPTGPMSAQEEYRLNYEREHQQDAEGPDQLFDEHGGVG